MPTASGFSLSHSRRADGTAVFRSRPSLHLSSACMSSCCRYNPNLIACKDQVLHLLYEFAQPNNRALANRLPCPQTKLPLRGRSQSWTGSVLEFSNNIRHEWPSDYSDSHSGSVSFRLWGQSSWIHMLGQFTSGSLAQHPPRRSSLRTTKRAAAC